MTVLLPGTAPSAADCEPLDALALDLDGWLARPGDPEWDDARRAWQLAVDQRPAAVVVAGSVRDVAVTVRTARALGLQVAPQSTGHNAAPLGDLSGTILLRTSGLRSVSVEPQSRTARAEAGALWGDVTDAAAQHGLAALAGSSRDVGVAGYTLGGGLSWLARSHGLACNAVTALDVVTADGVSRRVDAHHFPDLFWALRGGGGSTAVVTALEFRLFPLTTVQAGVLFFPVERAGEVLHAWRDWLASVPDAVTSVGRVLHFPPLPDLPPQLSGRSYAVIELTSSLDEAATRALVAPLRALGPTLDTLTTTAVADLGRLHMDPDGPVPAHGDGLLLRRLSPAAIDEVVRLSAPGTALLSLEIRHLGGALTPGRASDPGAADGLAAPFLMFAVGITPTPEAAAAVRAAVDAVKVGLRPWAADAMYPNFAESPIDARSAFGTSLPGLHAVKRRWDRTDLIRANHPVSPAD